MLERKLGWLALTVALLPLDCRCSAPSVSSTGVVRSSTGEAIAGARVCAWPLAIDSRAVGWRPTCTVADEQGRYVLELSPDTTVHVVADAEGFLPGHHRAHPVPSRPWLTVSEDPPPSIDVTLEPGGQWHRGRVVDHEGLPIVDGTVVLTSFDGDRIPVSTLAVTDASGGYDAWGHASARAQARIDGGVLFDEIERETPEGPEHVVIPGSSIRGRVLTSTGTMAAGARVTVRDGPRSFGNAQLATFADGMGYFELRGLVPGEHTLVAHTRHEVGTASPVWLGLDDVAARITVRMTQPLAPLHARVVDADTGEAVPHCQIGLGPAGDERRVLPSWFHTDGRGRLDIELVPGARVVEGLSCPGHAARPPYPAIEVGDPIPAELQWEVDRGVGFRGRLVDAHGNPAAGRWVSLSADDPALSDLTFFIADPSIQTASDGTFEVPGLRPGRYRLYAGQDSTLGPIHVQVPVTEELTTIRLPPTGRLEAAVPGARDRLYLHAIACPLRSPYASMDPFEDPPSPPSSSAFTRSGRVVFEAIAPGRYALSHERRESACELDGRTVVVSVAADRTTTTTLHVPASVAASRTISGTVLGPSGEPHRGAFVELLERGSIVAPKQDDPLDWTGFTNPRTVTDEAGRFAFFSRAPGEYVVRAHARGLQGHAAADAREGDGTVALTLR